MANAHAPGQARAARRAIWWRIHVWSALIATPFTAVAALTGMLYVLTPQVEAWRYGALDRVAAGGTPLALDQSVAAAIAAAPPGAPLQAVYPPAAPGASLKAVFGKGAAGAHAGHSAAQMAQMEKMANSAPRGRQAAALTIYIDPASGAVLGAVAGEERFGSWARRLHSRLLQGDGWRWMIELAASAMLVMLLTGVLLWWPASPRQALPRAGLRGRPGWKQWHAVPGAALGLLTLAIVATGLTWSQYGGQQIRSTRDALGQAPPRVPTGLASVLPHGPALLGWQAAWDQARRLAPEVALQMTPPALPDGVWRISAADPSRPTRRFDLLLDAYSGQPLFYGGWQQQTAFGKATAIGIPFHRGEFGWWNQALLLVFGAGVLFSLLSGWVMWFLRRRHGGPLLPPVAPGAWRAAAIPLLLTGAVLTWFAPLAGVAAAAVWAIEGLRLRARR
ncbi:PepSY-associated TM helix domain-containing protein [Massilia sp. DWR3-1-1]|uniref:PepSY-associated TM helix domain-containing protein n=1 Tax=Massilia sp. DWR3-1-1 TaxID=2804559 RepID=UPI003CF31CFD